MSILTSERHRLLLRKGWFRLEGTPEEYDILRDHDTALRDRVAELEERIRLVTLSGHDIALRSALGKLAAKCRKLEAQLADMQHVGQAGRKVYLR